MSTAAADPSAPLAPARDPATDEALAQVAAFEAGVRPGLVARVLRTVGRTATFAWVYSRIGPRFDTWLGRRFPGAFQLYGLPALLLVTTGAKSGLPRTSPLLYLRDGDDFLVVGTNFGQLHHPAWTGNLLAQPRAMVELGPAKVPVLAQLLDEASFQAQWPRFVAIYPGYADYLARCGGRAPRMFRLAPRAASA